jgi:RHS repeat-associated protein
MIAFGGATLTYDANGNLTNDGTSTCDARNHLTAISGAATASFTYDAFGRRASKTIAGASTQFLYDILNPVQELQGGTPSANLLTGGRLDEYFTRTDSSNNVATVLQDGLGAAIGLVGSGQSIATSYTYQPFGATTVGGAANGNAYQFTGREHDGTGLYFYRARYYHPTFQRFLSQDPIRFLGGDPNLYGYVQESPTNSADPVGLCGNKPCPPVPPSPPGASVNNNIQATMQVGANSLVPTDGVDPQVAAIWWISNVSPGGDWDYKRSGPEYDQFGNFNYGATGAAAGIPESTLLWAAGVVKWAKMGGNDPWGSPWGGAPWGNEPDKQNDIANGYQYFENGCW